MGGMRADDLGDGDEDEPSAPEVVSRLPLPLAPIYQSPVAKAYEQAIAPLQSLLSRPLIDVGVIGSVRRWQMTMPQLVDQRALFAAVETSRLLSGGSALTGALSALDASAG